MTRRSCTDVVRGNRNFHTLLISDGSQWHNFRAGPGSCFCASKTLHSFPPCPTAAMMVCGLDSRRTHFSKFFKFYTSYTDHLLLLHGRLGLRQILDRLARYDYRSLRKSTEKLYCLAKSRATRT